MKRGEFNLKICLNGHIVKELEQNVCPQCGSQIITECPACYSAFQEYDHLPTVCVKCGHIYPWTKEKLQSLKELAEKMDYLTRDERNILEDSICEIIRETPFTPVAAIRVKKIIEKLGPKTSIFKDQLLDISSETAKEIIWTD
ncbi:MAG: DUF2321 domain-containing protein [Tepidibacillus sp.]